MPHRRLPCLQPDASPGRNPSYLYVGLFGLDAQQESIGRLRTNGVGLCARLSKKLSHSLDVILDVLAGATHRGRVVSMYYPRLLFI
jgi:hypothetical protein